VGVKGNNRPSHHVSTRHLHLLLFATSLHRSRATQSLPIMRDSIDCLWVIHLLNKGSFYSISFVRNTDLSFDLGDLRSRISQFCFSRDYYTETISMAIIIEDVPLVPISRPKTRLLKGLVRHASAPACPRLTLDHIESNKGYEQTGKHNAPSSPKPSNMSPRWKPNLLSELSLAQSVVVSHLRLCRDKWRSTAQIQGKQLLANELELKRQEYTINALEGQNAVLQARHEEVVSTNNSLFSRLQNALSMHEKLFSQLKDSDRATARLKKSDRAKGKVWQRNLRLKTMLHHRHAAQTASGTSQQDTGTETGLLEALTLASERIEELEGKGIALVDILEQRNNSCGSEQDENVCGGRLLEAEIAFRNVLEDETCREQKEHWGEMLKE
jgi:hypothetical protein